MCSGHKWMKCLTSQMHQLCMCGGMMNNALVATGVCAITHRRGLVACSSGVFVHTSRLSDECMLSLCICGYVVCV